MSQLHEYALRIEVRSLIKPKHGGQSIHSTAPSVLGKYVVLAPGISELTHYIRVNLQSHCSD